MRVNKTLAFTRGLLNFSRRLTDSTGTALSPFDRRDLTNCLGVSKHNSEQRETLYTYYIHTNQTPFFCESAITEQNNRRVIVFNEK